MDKKHYIITSITLGLIGAASAGLIGAANLLTRKQIAQNELDKINSGIIEIFGKNASIESENSLSGYKYTNYSYYIKDSGDDIDRYAFKTTGSNSYGKISLLVGFTMKDSGVEFVGLSIIVNEQTYASTLVDNYINPLNSGDVSIDDVNCGATYGAKLVRNMINDAQIAANDIAEG
ncbi:MAG: hypothetical protein J6M95_02435 [Bacilli bacterium]|nr:hypothetical protein [Bacilli bacterium]